MIDLPSWVDKEAWAAYLEMRLRMEKVKKVPWTPGAEKGALRDLGKLYAAGEDPTDVLWQSATRGWAGLFEVKKKQARPQPQEFRREKDPPADPQRKAEIAELLRRTRQNLTRH